MPTIKSLQEEINQLKEQSKKQSQWIAYLKKRQTELSKKVSVLDPQNEPPVKEEVINRAEVKQPKSESGSALGIVLIIVGALLCISVIGAIVGIPLLIWGIVIQVKKSKVSSQDSSQKQVSKTIKKSKPVEKSVQPSRSEDSFEEAVGMKWFARIGILALVIGVGFFIKYAIDMNWITHTARIVLGTLFGIALIFFGIFMAKKEKYELFGKTLIGGGFAITYFVVYAAYHFPIYRQATGMSFILDIILLSVLVLFAILFSVKDNSRVIAGIAFLLGYVTALLGNEVGSLALLYSLILTAGLAIVVAYKQWSVLGIFGVIASYVLYVSWTFGDAHTFGTATFFLVAQFLIFTILSFTISNQKELSGKTLGITLLNSGLFFIIYLLTVQRWYPDYTGLFSLICALFFFFLYTVYKKRESMAMSATHFYLGMLFIILAIPLHFNAEWVTIIWAVGGVLLMLLFLKSKLISLKISAYALALIAAIKTVVYDIAFLDQFSITNISESTRLFSFLATIISFFIMYRLMKTNKDLFSQQEDYLADLFSWFASGFLVLVIALELFKDHAVWITILLSSLALIYITIIREKPFQYQAYAISLLVLLKIVVYDSWMLNSFSGSEFWDSTRFFSFGITLLAFYSISWFLKVKQQKTENFDIADGYSYAATLVTVIFMALEMKEFWVSVGWSILALIIMSIGFSSRTKHLRLQGMLLFAITIAKVFLYDTRNLETIYRTVSYMVLGVLLLLVSFIYTKFKEKLKEIL